MSMRNPVDLSVERCPDGFLRNPEDWNEELARKLASEWSGLVFTDEHMDLITFMRSYYFEHHIPPMYVKRPITCRPGEWIKKQPKTGYLHFFHTAICNRAARLRVCVDLPHGVSARSRFTFDIARLGVH